jgi:hypothetical protein
LGRGESDGGVSLEVKAKEFINPTAKFATYEEVHARCPKYFG